MLYCIKKCSSSSPLSQVGDAIEDYELFPRPWFETAGTVQHFFLMQHFIALLADTLILNASSTAVFPIYIAFKSLAAASFTAFPADSELSH